jgi:hypothetical protein
MTFKSKFPIATLAIMFAIVGGAVLLFGHDSCHRGRHDLALAGILALAAIIPESPGSARITPENYSIESHGP